MGHAVIVELQPYPIKKEEWVDQEQLIEDVGILYHTDYVGDCYNDINRKEYIKTELPELFFGIATVDPESETVTFLKSEEINKTIKDEIDKAVSFLRRNIALEDSTFYNFRHIGNCFRHDYTIIWSELSSYTSAQFIEEARYKAGETMYIGAIYDYHI